MLLISVLDASWLYNSKYALRRLSEEALAQRTRSSVATAGHVVILLCHTTDMPNPTFIGLVHSILSSAEAALGEINSPMVKHLMKDGALSRRTGEKSLALLEMLQEKTLGNLDETERASLHQALQSIRQRLETAVASDDDISSMHN